MVMTHSPSARQSGIGAKEFTILVALLMSIVAISIDALLPALGIIGEALNATDANQPQLLIGLMFLGMAIGQLVAGPMSDALGRKPILFTGFALYFVGTFLCHQADTMDALMVGRFVQGLGVAGPYIAAVSLVRDMFSGAQMARTMSLVMMIFVLVPAIAPTLGQAVMFLSDWRAVFIMYFVYAGLLVIWIATRLRETLPKEERIPMTLTGFSNGFKEVLTHRKTASYMVCMGLFFGSFMGYLNSSQQIFQVQFEVGVMFSVYFGALALVLGVSSLVNSRIVEKYGMRPIALSAIVTIVMASGIFLALHALVTIQLWMFLIYAAVLFFCFGLLFGNVNAMAMEPMGHVAGIASAVIGSVSAIMSMGIGTVIGQLYDNSLIPVTTGFTVLGALAFLIMKWAEAGNTDLDLDPATA
jgi:DHA1 family bicyclomycin/chloramphenicol resistance-like MFS transporter